MTTTPNMNLTLPTEGGSYDVWAVLLEAVFALVDAHDHTTGKGVQIPSAALNVNANIQLASSGNHFALYDAMAYDFFPSAAAAVTGFVGALFMSSADNELYWRNATGTNVKITNGAALNVAAFTGGIGGDYAAVGALESFDDATQRYLFQGEGAPRPWAGLAAGNVDIYQQAASIANRVRLQSPNALAASYALTLPAALPAAAQVVTVDAAGVMRADGQLGAAQYVKHGNQTRTVPLGPGAIATSGLTNTVGTVGILQAQNTDAYYPTGHYEANERIQFVDVYATVVGGNASFNLYQTAAGFGYVSLLAGGTPVASSASSTRLTVAAPAVFAFDVTLWIEVVTGAGVSCRLFNAAITSDVP